jgi:hypothetical protein
VAKIKFVLVDNVDSEKIYEAKIEIGLSELYPGFIVFLEEDAGEVIANVHLLHKDGLGREEIITFYYDNVRSAKKLLADDLYEHLSAVLSRLAPYTSKGANEGSTHG